MGRRPYRRRGAGAIGSLKSSSRQQQPQLPAQFHPRCRRRFIAVKHPHNHIARVFIFQSAPPV
nr:MAG TPA: hypothetical protein [Caudoviricetes sp.]